ncbi:hypothetical protein EDC01DRAFT_294949 [Geopyxis carbonaria]|nr:hypothetical protein EDC01DRAFT_294949 [Geopyxis carbonaria]
MTSQTPTKKVFRAVGLPPETTETEICDSLKSLVRGTDPKLCVLDTWLVPGCTTDYDTTDAIITIEAPFPAFLERLIKAPTETYDFEVGDSAVLLDANFFGFTQMYPTKADVPIEADIIAVSGLDGHAYDSWKSNGNLQRMWLRHFFKQNFPSCRTMTWGMDTSLTSQAAHSVLDYSRAFLDEIKTIRTTEEEQRRPLHLIGYDLGGVILSHALVQAKFDQDSDGSRASLLKATYGIAFFGTPHRGLTTENMIQTLEKCGHHNSHRIDLLNEINLDSKTLAIDFRRFVDMCPNFKIRSFYERVKTRALIPKSNTKSYTREGAHLLLVDSSSAVIGLPGMMEIKTPVDCDHINMVKFKSMVDPTYKSIREFMEMVVHDAPKVVSNRFRRMYPRYITLAEL